MLKFTIKLDIRKKYFNKDEIHQLEYLLERTLQEWDASLARQINVTNKKLLKFWESGCGVEISYEI